MSDTEQRTRMSKMLAEVAARPSTMTTVERARCLAVALEVLERGPGFDASKDFADGYSLAAQEIAAGIQGKVEADDPEPQPWKGPVTHDELMQESVNVLNWGLRQANKPETLPEAIAKGWAEYERVTGQSE